MGRLIKRTAVDVYTNAEIDEMCNNISDPWDPAPEWFFSASAKAFRNECERMMAEEFCSFNDLTDAQRKAMRAEDPDWFDEEFYGKDSLKNDFDESEEDAETRQDFLDELEYRRSSKSCTRDGEYTGYNLEDMGSAGDVIMPRDYLPELFQQAKEKYLYGKLLRE